jgi:large subunit ribosomal protein L22
MEVRAEQKHILISPRKLRLVIDKVRGLPASQAMAVLDYIPKKGAKFVQKTLASAMANARNNYDLDTDNMYVAEIYANEGPRLKRMKAGARGRYKPRVRRTAHLMVVLAEREEA